jgi:hypothetical protein
MKRHNLYGPIHHGALILGGVCLLAACSNDPTSGGAGGKSSTTVAAGGNAGGSSSTGRGGTGGSASSASGGSSGSGGAAGSGGTARSGGATGAGGSIGSGGTAASSGSGGRAGSGGTGGSNAGGAGGVTNSGGSPSTGGSGRDAGADRPPDTNNGTGGRTDGSARGGTAAGGGGAGGQATGGAGTGGSATGGSTGSTINDGCLSDLAKGVSISEIAVFQAGKISVMKNGTEATPRTAQGGQIIQGKNALFRVYVTVDSGFQSRDLSARLMLNGQTAGYYAKTAISASSTELTASNSFNISVPGSAITASLDYEVEIVECGTGSGTAHSPVFPSSGVADLATLETGPLRLTVVPVTSDGVTPTLDQAFADSLKNYFDSMYPTSGTEVTINSTPIAGCTVTAATASDGTAWSNCLNNVLSRRRTDRPANDVYYVGVLQPTSTFSSYCRSSCIMGISPVASVSAANSRASLIVGYSGYAPSTAAHEVGHAHGLQHSPGCGASQADPAFPYVTGGKAYIGWVGWDKQQTPTTFFDPAKYTDIMAYCSPQWISDYVFKKLGDRIIALSGALIITGPARTWRMAFESSIGLWWGTPVTDPIPAEGDPVAARVLDAAGTAIAQITVYRTPTSIETAFYMVPDPEPGWAAIAIGEARLAF